MLDRGNRLWFGALPPTRSQDFWVPSLYVGVLGSILACGSACVRRALPWCALATGMFVVGSLGSLGEDGSPLLWARHLPYLSGMLGPLDSPMNAGVRIDGCLRDGDGSPYWLLTAALPGFDGFRFPSKLLTMACLGVVMLAGLGWDEVALGNGSASVAARGMLATFVLMGFVVGRGPLIERYLGERAGGLVSSMGPFDLPGALGDLHASLWHAVVALSITLLILRVAKGDLEQPEHSPSSSRRLTSTPPTRGSSGRFPRPSLINPHDWQNGSRPPSRKAQPGPVPDPSHAALAAGRVDPFGLVAQARRNSFLEPRYPGAFNRGWPEFTTPTPGPRRSCLIIPFFSTQCRVVRLPGTQGFSM